MGLMIGKGKMFAISAAVALGMAVSAQPALACTLGDSYIGSICSVAYRFCPAGTTRADGQFMAIQQFPALFSLMGVTYGGDGVHSFRLPDLNGAEAIRATGRITEADLNKPLYCVVLEGPYPPRAD